MGVDQRIEAFVQEHIKRRKGERRGRLERGSRHAETLFLRNVWWPLRGDFNQLHPEYEVLDWRGRSYFADFAYLPGPFKLLIEIKGYGAHVSDMDRQKFSNELNRETFLCAMGYQVISFSYDDVERQPELCMTLLRMVLSRYTGSGAPSGRGLLVEKEIMRFVILRAGDVRPKDIRTHFELDARTVRKLLGSLQDKG